LTYCKKRLQVLTKVDVPNFAPSVKEISKRLNISEYVAKVSWNKLVKLKIVGKVDGRWIQVKAPFKVDNLESNQATRTFQNEMIQKAQDALFEVHADKRDVTSITLAMSYKDMDKAREMVTQFRENFASTFHTNAKSNAVFNLTVQLVPVSL